MGNEFTQEDDDLLAELGVDAEVKVAAQRTPREERIVAGFEEIQRFFEQHGRAPQHGGDKDIFERLYAVRLERIRNENGCVDLLNEIDLQGLLDGQSDVGFQSDEDMDDEALLAALGVEDNDISQLKFVRSSTAKRAAEEVAAHNRCEDFEKFKPLFDVVQTELNSGLRTTRPFVKDLGISKAEIKAGEFFILGGQTAYVADVGDPISAPNGESDARLRVIYSNGTESNILLRSLQRALYKDEAGRRVAESTAGPLFADKSNEGDEASGTIYVLRSKSDNQLVVDNQNLVHKIGVTGGSVEKRIANAKLDATFLLADVEIVATYELYNVNRNKLEKLIHKIFAPAQLEIELKDRFGNPVNPREWFLVPMQVIDEAVGKILDGTIANHVYDPSEAKLVSENSG